MGPSRHVLVPRTGMHLTLRRAGLVLPRYRVHAHYNRNFSTVAMNTYWRREAERRFAEAVAYLTADGEEVVDLGGAP